MQTKRKSVATVGSRFLKLFSLVLCGLALFAARSVEGATSTNVVSLELVRPEIPEPAAGSTITFPFLFKRTGPTNTPLVVSFVYAGTATRGVDYMGSNTVVIPAGASQYQFFPLYILGGDAVEGDETIVAELIAPGSSPEYVVDPERNRAIVSIRDRVDPDSLPTVSIEASRPFTREPFPLSEPGLVTMRRTGPTNTSLTVHAFWGGVARIGLDYEANTNDWVFAPGQTVLTREVTPLADELAEGEEAVGVQVIGQGGVYNTDSEKRFTSVTIVDEDTTPPTNVVVSITSRIPDVAEVGEDKIGYLSFGLRRTGPTNAPLTVLLSYEGSATKGQDYIITNVVVMPPGAAEFPFGLQVLPDEIVEGEETVIAMLFAASGYNIDAQQNHAVAVIHDNDQPISTNAVVTIEKNMDVSEPATGSAGFYPFILRRAGATNTHQLVFLRYSGTATAGVDYTITNVVVIPPGAREFPFFMMRVHADDLVEGDETVIADILPSTTYATEPFKDRAMTVIHDQIERNDVLVSIESRMERITEPETGSMVYYPFALRRTGSTNEPLVVQLHFGGTATRHQDYSMTETVIIPPGAREFPWIPLRAHADNLVEGPETIVAEIAPTNTYAIFAELSRARVTLVDRGFDGSPVATILRPGNGTVFSEGDVINIFAIGTDPDGIVRKLEIYADGHLLASVHTNNLSVAWTNAPLGLHELVARATDNQNNVGEGAPVSILVRGRDASAFVFRRLPDAYTRGLPFRVDLRAEPLASVQAYAVEDQPPSGWEVSNVSDDGAFDPHTGKVKFGPFSDRSPRRLSYTLTPPVNAAGTHEFSGLASANGTSHPIAGDRLIAQGTTHHPADVNPADFRMVLDEVTAYAAAWKTGPSNNVPLSYVTRAGYLWKNGETYNFLASAGNPPLCWVPFFRFEAPLSAAAVEPAEGQTIRFIRGIFEPGVPVETEIWVRPPSGTWAVAVEEQVPNGWSVGTISDGGIFDEGTGTIRWGVFLDDSDRSLRYTLKPPMDLVRIGRVRGLVSFDGINQEISPQRVISVNEEKLPVLERVERREGGVRVTLTGEPGQVGALQRSSDLVNWQDVTTLFLPDGTLEYIDENRAGPRLYYRLQIR